MVDRFIIMSLWSGRNIGWTFLEASRSSSGIIIMWNDTSIVTSDITKGRYTLSLLLSLVDGFQFWIIGVYGPNRYKERPVFGRSYMIFLIFVQTTGSSWDTSMCLVGPTRNQMAKSLEVWDTSINLSGKQNWSIFLFKMGDIHGLITDPHQQWLSSIGSLGQNICWRNSILTTSANIRSLSLDSLNGQWQMGTFTLPFWKHVAATSLLHASNWILVEKHSYER